MSKLDDQVKEVMRRGEELLKQYKGSTTKTKKVIEDCDEMVAAAIEECRETDALFEEAMRPSKK